MTIMVPEDGSDVVVELPGPNIKQATAYSAPYPDEHDTPNTGASNIDLLWWLFIFGWVFPPCFWVGIAVGAKRRKSGALKPTQAAAWKAHIAMTVISAVLIILVCSIHLTLRKPGGWVADAGSGLSGGVLAQFVHSCRPPAPQLFSSLVTCSTLMTLISLNKPDALSAALCTLVKLAVSMQKCALQMCWPA
jgi:hypothetical protein